MTHFLKSEMDFTTGKPICPECKNHKQIELGDWDCKNTYGEHPNTGQCCCYSNEHK